MNHFLLKFCVLVTSAFLWLHDAVAQTAITRTDPVGAASDAGDAALASLKSDFDLLKILGLVGIVVAVVLGLALYTYRHRRLMQYDAVSGLLLTVLVAPALFVGFTQILGPESRACFSATVAGGADAVPFDSACASAREGAANLIGLKSLWRTAMGESIVNGMITSLGAGIVKLLMYLSVTVGAALLYLLIRPVLKRLG